MSSGRWLRPFRDALPGGIIFALHCATQKGVFVDDAYIFYRYAANAAGGLGLVYNAGEGWKFADHSAAKLVSVAHQEGPTGLIEPLPTDTLQSVYVDGPTGYVFVYVMDEGWRFVGSVADAKR